MYKILIVLGGIAFFTGYVVILGQAPVQVCNQFGANCATITNNKLDTNATFSGTLGNVAIVTAGSSGAPVPGSADYVGFRDSAGNLRGATVATVGNSSAVDVMCANCGTFTGTVTVSSITNALPAGTNLIGTVLVTGYGQGQSTSGATGPLMMGSVTTAAPTYTNGTMQPPSLDTSGGLRVAVISGGGGGATVGSAVPSTAVYGGADVAGTLRGLTATNTTGSTYALDVNIVAGGGTGGTASTVGAATPSTATAIGGDNGTDMVVPRVADIDTSGSTHYTLETVLMNPGNPAAAVTFTADAANQSAVASAPLPVGAVYKSGGNALVDGQVGYLAADNQSHAILAGCGTAGTPACGVVTVQGVTSMTPLAVSGTVNVGTISAVGGTVTVTNLTGSLLNTIAVGNRTSNSAAATSDAIAAIPGIASFAQPSYVEGRAVAISLTTNGAARFVMMDPVNDRSAKVDANGNLQVISPGITHNTTPSTLTDGQVGDFQITPNQSLFVAEEAGLPVKVIGLTGTIQTVVGAAAVLTTLNCTTTDTVMNYVQVFDSASPSLGSTASFPLGLPPSGGNIGPIKPMKFTNSIKLAATTDVQGSTAVGAGKVNCWVGYRTP